MAQKAKKGLGRGFDSLLPADFDKKLVVNDDEHIQKVAISQITTNSEQPRKHFDEIALKELAKSISTHGILLPLVVSRQKDGSFLLIAGERRWRAAQLAGLSHVPVVARTMKALEQIEISLIENVQRVDLSPLEQAATLRRLHEQFSTSYDQIAERVGKASSTVNNIVRLLQLPEEAQVALAKKMIHEGHARALLSLQQNRKQQSLLLKSILKYGWSVRQAERFVMSLKSDSGTHAPALQRVATETKETKRLSQKYGLPVQVKKMAKGGKLEIRFSSEEQLNQLLQKL